jgi:hypothetical protein
MFPTNLILHDLINLVNSGDEWHIMKLLSMQFSPSSYFFLPGPIQ